MEFTFRRPLVHESAVWLEDFSENLPTGVREQTPEARHREIEGGPQVFFGKDGSLYAVHVDDLIYTGSNLEKMRTVISSEFKAKHAG